MKKLLSILAVSTVTALALTGCSTSKLTRQANVNYIGVDTAKNTALSNANIDGSSAVFTEAKLDNKNGTAYYEVDFTSNGIEYEYNIDAITGTIIEHKQIGNPSVNNNNTSTNTNSVDNIQVADNNTNSTNNTNNTNNTNSAKTGAIDENKAKQVALNHAGVTEADTSFIWAKPDFDDGIQIFEVEFYVPATKSEYDYEINAQTGEIISFDYDAENYTPSTTNNNSTTKTEAEIKKIALDKVPGATANDIHLELDRDDGKVKYEGKIIYQGMEYDFEIDAYSGAILEWESESIFD